MARLADARHDDAAGAAAHELHGLAEGIVEVAGKRRRERKKPGLFRLDGADCRRNGVGAVDFGLSCGHAARYRFWRNLSTGNRARPSATKR